MDNIYSFSKEESDRFKMNIVRAKVNEINLKELSSNIFKYKTDIMFLRIPCEKIETLSEINQLGFNYIQTDTLVYYSVDFSKYEPQGLINNDLLFEEANSSHFLLIDKLVKAIFKGYTNHYNSNPYLRKDDITEGYVEWVKNYIGGENKKVFLIYRNSEPIAFATCHNQNDIAEGVLYGVLPEHSGGGVYSDIIRYTQKYYQQSGAKSMEVSTQVQNYAVQKVWNREGFKLSRSYATIHINSLLNYSIEPQREYKQDLNKDRIDSSADCLAEILRILSQEYPGSGTIFLTNKNSFLKPLDGNEPYKIVQNLIAFDENNKIYKFNMTVYNSENEVCLLSENDVIKK